MKPYASSRALSQLLLLILILLHYPCPAGSAQVSNPLQLAVFDLLESGWLGSGTEEPVRPGDREMDQQLTSLYADREMKPLWVSTAGPGPRAQIILDTLTASYDEGLDPGHYGVAELSRLWNSRTPADLARIDILLSRGLQRYLADAAYGRSEPCLLDPGLFASARNRQHDSSPLLLSAYHAPDLQGFLEKQLPSHDTYRLLRSALLRYRTLAGRGGWDAVPSGDLVKPGMEDVRITAVRKRLAMTGDYSGGDLHTLRYGPRLTAAVQKFQARHNLAVDGIIGPNTLAAMNVPVEDRIEQILINMERWRWLPHRMAERGIFVNIAGFYLQAVHNTAAELFMPVIVGEIYHKTPVFSDLIRYIEFNPYWNIPSSIAVNEMLPEIRKDPAYLKGKNIKILDGWKDNAAEIDPAAVDWHRPAPLTGYRLRQEPGPDNALGRIKFMFPNRFNVYLHDTPAHELFKHHNRAFSHGCIRVSQPISLAYYLLSRDDATWTVDRINSLLMKGKRTVVTLQQPVPVHILYRTVMVDPADGAVFFFADLYGRDRLLAEALFPRGSSRLCRYPVEGTGDQEMN